MQPRSEDPALSVRLVRVLLALSTFYATLTAITMAVVAAAPPAFVRVHAEQIEPLFNAMIGHGVVGVSCAAAMLLLRRRRSMSPRIAKAMLVMTTLGLILSVDRIVDVIYPVPLSKNGIFRLHPQRGWAHIPGAEEFLLTRVRIDDLGLRVPDTGPIREIRDKRRILFLGDSVTFGYRHLAEKAYCEQAVALLNRRHPDLHAACLNAGVIGYDPGQAHHFLIEEGLALEPSLVVLQLCLNDVTHAFDVAAPNRRDRHPEYAQAAPPDHWSGLHRLAVRLFTDEQKALAAAEHAQHFHLEELLAPRRSARVEQAWQRTLSQIAPIVDTCRKRELPLVILCFPVLHQVADLSVSVEPQEVFAALARRGEVPYVDVLSAWEAVAPRGSPAARSFVLDDTHPTALGHRLAAEALVDKLDASGVLDELSRR